MTFDRIAIEGLDLDDARLRIESSDLLVELLLEFSSSWASGAARIASALAANDSVEAGKIAHALTGVAATLGLVDVRHAARRIEEQLGGDEGTPVDGARLDGDVRSLAAALARVTSSIERTLGPGSSP